MYILKSFSGDAGDRRGLKPNDTPHRRSSKPSKNFDTSSDNGDTSPLLNRDVNNWAFNKKHDPYAMPSDNSIINGFGGETNKAYNDGLGYLPPRWEIAYTKSGEKYFIE